MRLPDHCTTGLAYSIRSFPQPSPTNCCGAVMTRLLFLQVPARYMYARESKIHACHVALGLVLLSLLPNS